jgi:hypothetical protein
LRPVWTPMLNLSIKKLLWFSVNLLFFLSNLIPQPWNRVCLLLIFRTATRNCNFFRSNLCLRQFFFYTVSSAYPISLSFLIVHYTHQG